MATKTSVVLLQTAVPALVGLAGQFAAQAMREGAMTQQEIDALWEQSKAEWLSAVDEWNAQQATHET